MNNILTEKEKKAKLFYEKQLALPKWKYVIVYGVFIWGLSVAVIITVFEMWRDKVSFTELMENEMYARLFLFPVAGVFFGFYMRKLFKKQLDKIKEKESFPEQQK